MTDNFEKKVAVDGPVVNAGELGSSTFSPGQALPAGPLGLGQRWTVARKREVVLRLLRDEPVQLLSRQLGVEIFRLEQWREKAIGGIDASLKQRKGDPVQAELDSAMKRIGELTMQVELLEAKTGGRVVPLGPEARAILAGLSREDDNPWVIAGRLPRTHITDLQKPWRRIRARAGLEDVRIHDLRHSYASRALALGESLTMIGKLLGHTQVQTTARYAHLARDSIQTAAARITGSIGGDLSSVHDVDKPTRQ